MTLVSDHPCVDSASALLARWQIRWGMHSSLKAPLTDYRLFGSLWRTAVKSMTCASIVGTRPTFRTALCCVQTIFMSVDGHLLDTRSSESWPPSYDLKVVNEAFKSTILYKHVEDRTATVKVQVRARSYKMFMEAADTLVIVFDVHLRVGLFLYVSHLENLAKSIHMCRKVESSMPLSQS